MAISLAAVSAAAETPALKDVTSLKFLVVVEDDAVPAMDMPVYPFEGLYNTPVPARWCDWGVEKDLAAILYTSGSTGKPKGVMLSHAHIMAGATIVSTYLQITENDRILAALRKCAAPWKSV